MAENYDRYARQSSISMRMTPFQELIGFSIVGVGIYFVMWKVMLDCKNKDTQDRARRIKLGLDPDKVT